MGGGCEDGHWEGTSGRNACIRGARKIVGRTQVLKRFRRDHGDTFGPANALCMIHLIHCDHQLPALRFCTPPRVHNAHTCTHRAVGRDEHGHHGDPALHGRSPARGRGRAGSGRCCRAPPARTRSHANAAARLRARGCRLFMGLLRLRVCNSQRAQRCAVGRMVSRAHNGVVVGVRHADWCYTPGKA